MAVFWRWWVIVCFSSLAIWFAFDFNLIQQMFEADQTHITKLLFGLYWAGTAIIGYLSFKLARGKNIHLENAWHTVSYLPEIGMFGTLIGFSIVAGPALADIDLERLSTVVESLKIMGQGFSTAIYTTLMALAGSILLKLQVINLENAAEK